MFLQAQRDVACAESCKLPWVPPRPAGYGGHVPSEAQPLPAGGPSGSARVKREDALLYHLDQHSRGLVPGYTGHRPQDKARVSLQAPVPTAATTQVRLRGWLVRVLNAWRAWLHL